MTIRRVLLILAIVGASTVAVQGKTILGQGDIPSHEKPTVTEKSRWEQFEASEEGRELTKLIEDMLAGKASNDDFVAYQRKYNATSAVPKERSQEPWPTGTPPVMRKQ
jgi:hypothetical protein